MVKVTFPIVVVLLFLCPTTTAWFGGGGGRSNSNNNGGDKSGNKGGGKEKGTSVDVGVEASKGGGVKASGGISHQGDGWKGGAEATVDDKGNWGVKAGVSVEIGKRSVDWNGRHYTVKLDPCNFGFYDVNNDGVIVKSEMVGIFGENTKADELFDALDLTTGDGRIEEEEFYFMSAVTIDECQSKE